MSADAGDDVLSIHGLTVHYGKIRALGGVDLRVRRSRIATIVGSNGAGKTTLMKTVIGLIKPSAGGIRFEGRDITAAKVEDIAGTGISLVPEGRRLFANMTVLDNLKMGAYRRSDHKAVRADLEQCLQHFPVLGERIGSPARTLSGGQQQMLAVARALMSAPRLLMLDEPSIGLAPAMVETIAGIVRTISGTGVDILLVEQNAHMALQLADDAFVLENGEIVMSGAAKDLAGTDFVRGAYLSV